MPRYGHASVAVSDKIYVLCGQNSYGHSLNSFEKFDTKQNSHRWQLIEVSTEVLKPRYQMLASLARQDEIYVMGGIDADD